MIESIGINPGTVFSIFVVFLIAMYFVIKWAVKNGINQSMLFSDDDRRIKYEEDMKQFEEFTKNKKE